MRRNHRPDFCRIVALLLAGVMVLSLTACGRRNQNSGDGIPESTGGKDLARAELADNVFSLNSNPNYSKNPFVATNHSNQLLCCLVYENMVEVDENFHVIPNVIGSWTSNDDSTVWSLTLDTEHEHTFSDGDPVTGRPSVLQFTTTVTAGALPVSKVRHITMTA